MDGPKRSIAIVRAELRVAKNTLERNKRTMEDISSHARDTRTVNRWKDIVNGNQIRVRNLTAEYRELMQAEKTSQ